MSQKKLEKGSIFEKYDVDGDGIVTDEEMEMFKEMESIERADRKQRQQRYMAWYSLIGMISYPFAIMMCELVGLDNSAKLLTDIAPTYFIAAAGVAGAFMGYASMTKDK